MRSAARNPVRSRHHCAGAIAAWSVAGMFGVSLALEIIRLTREEGFTPIEWVLLALFVLLWISAFVGGLVALCGIRKHGYTTLLWKGLLGVGCSVIVGALIAPVFIRNL